MIRLGLRHVRQRRIVLSVVAAHLVDDEIERGHDLEREAATVYKGKNLNRAGSGSPGPFRPETKTTV
jgi:hypothetical protein